jgi:hypothetical protein
MGRAASEGPIAAPVRVCFRPSALTAPDRAAIAGRPSSAPRKAPPTALEAAGGHPLVGLQIFVRREASSAATAMQLTVATWDDRVVVVDLDADDPVENLCAILEVETGVPAAQQQLVFQGRPLAAGTTLGAAGVGNGDLIMLMRAQPAGGHQSRCTHRRDRACSAADAGPAARKSCFQADLRRPADTHPSPTPAGAGAPQQGRGGAARQQAPQVGCAGRAACLARPIRALPRQRSRRLRSRPLSPAGAALTPARPRRAQNPALALAPDGSAVAPAAFIQAIKMDQLTLQVGGAGRPGGQRALPRLPQHMPAPGRQQLYAAGCRLATTRPRPHAHPTARPPARPTRPQSLERTNPQLARIVRDEDVSGLQAELRRIKKAEVRPAPAAGRWERPAAGCGQPAAARRPRAPAPPRRPSTRRRRRASRSCWPPTRSTRTCSGASRR